ncbi:16S rRNA (cytosine1402-N4)-methyltransferase [Balneicella halophila]|uniref:Ribosomal RNA small subunit methyltransferase H n=1 Tax=Balneicella halophila TaxID=1537566 RepID=A0A7L4UQ49_BALHA|nr:16S rRNA (cytosine(1402)-N(4))-methyltransferase RsmH [Balneicella halophila]PVX50936.1 16S rRNA (cytosine1402-N4)-methyltransferase [Balneicella halophila]
MTEKYHIPVLLEESMDALKIHDRGVYVDLTFGGGGHTREILRRGAAEVICFDQDVDAKSNLVDDERITFVQHNFRYLKYFLRYLQKNQVDGVLADLGVSSHEFDEAGRGFSFRFDSPLDMRMNQDGLLTAYDVVNTYSEQQLATILKEYGELKNAKQLSRIIVSARSSSEIKTTAKLADIVAGKIPEFKRASFLAKVFQAIRIEVNDELGALRDVLMQMPEVIKPGGRLVVISYHSLEDRLVKRFMQTGNVAGDLEKDFYGNVIKDFKTIGKIQSPSEEEIAENSRARSAKLRVAERV